MAWIKLKSEFQTSMKVMAVAHDMEWTVNHTKGFLTSFWDWCLLHCDSGDLTNVNLTQLGVSLGLTQEESQKVFDSLVANKWIDTGPYIRVHGWWGNCKEYLKVKYYKQSGWKEIETAYSTGQRPFIGLTPIQAITKVPEKCVELAKLLFSLVKQNNANSIAKESNILSWANDIRILNEKNGQSFELIKEVLIWSQKDEFWKTNILSGNKLRVQWNKLTVRMNKTGGKNGRAIKSDPNKYT